MLKDFDAEYDSGSRQKLSRMTMNAGSNFKSQNQLPPMRFNQLSGALDSYDNRQSLNLNNLHSNDIDINVDFNGRRAQSRAATYAQGVTAT